MCASAMKGAYNSPSLDRSDPFGMTIGVMGDAHGWGNSPAPSGALPVTSGSSVQATTETPTSAPKSAAARAIEAGNGDPTASAFSGRPSSSMNIPRKRARGAGPAVGTAPGLNIPT